MELFILCSEIFHEFLLLPANKELNFSKALP